MLSEEFVASVCGPPLSTNTALAKDVGIYVHTLRPSVAQKAAFKKSSTPANCLAVSETHVFAAQHEKAYVHVYSRIRGNQEAFVPFAERIHSLALAGDVLVLGTAEGRLLLWETCTGRLVSTPPRHVQAVCAIATTRLHVLTGSEDSNVHVWSLLSLLELASTAEHEPDRSLTAHRAAITSLAVTQSSSPHTSLCVSASKDKTCIVWNYQSGDVLRTILFPSAPLCAALDPAGRALYVAAQERGLFRVELFAGRALVGPHSVEDAATVVQVRDPFGVADEAAGPAQCLGLTSDGSILLTGHANGQVLRWALGDEENSVELVNLNASVTNIIPLFPFPAQRATKAVNIVRPTQDDRRYTFVSQFESDLGADGQFDAVLHAQGFPHETLVQAIAALQQPASAGTAADLDLQRQNDELWQIIHEQRALQMETLERYGRAKELQNASADSAAPETVPAANAATELERMSE